MKLPVTVTTTIELAFNRYIALDSTAQKRFEQLKEAVICLHISGLDIRLYFIPSAKHIQIQNQYGDIPDATIQATPMTLMRLSHSDNPGKTFLESEATISGDTGVGMAFSQILREVDIHWEDLLSTLVGDIIAQHSAQLAKNTQGWLKDSAHAMNLNLSEYLSEESRDIAADAEVRHYIDQVDTLRDDAARLEAKVERLSKQLRNVHSPHATPHNQ